MEGITDIMFRGTMYIDARSFAIARAEFKMNVENRKDAVKMFIKRKPAKMKIEVTEASYVADFIESNGKWYFNYITNIIYTLFFFKNSSYRCSNWINACDNAGLFNL